MTQSNSLITVMDVPSRIQALVFIGLFLFISAPKFLSLLIVTCFVCLLLEQCRLPARLSLSISKLRLWFARLCVSSSVILFCGCLSLHVIIKIHSFLGNGIRSCLVSLKISPLLAMLVIGIAIREAPNMIFMCSQVWSTYFNRDPKSITTTS